MNYKAYYKDIKKRYIELKLGGKLPHIKNELQEIELDFLENENYNIYLNHKKIIGNDSATKNYEFNEMFEIRNTTEEMLVEPSIDLSSYASHTFKLGSEDVPFHLCFLGKKFNILFNVIKSLVGTKELNYFEAQQKFKEIEKEVFTKEQITIESRLDRAQNKLFEMSDKQTEAQRVYEIAKEELNKLEKESVKIGEQSKKIIEEYATAKEVLDTVKKEVVRTQEEFNKLMEEYMGEYGEIVAVSVEGDKIDKYYKIKEEFEKAEIREGLRDLFNFNLDSDIFIGITNKNTILNRFSFANKTKELVDILFSKKMSTKMIKASLIKIFNDKQSYINFSDFGAYYNTLYKVTKPELKDKSEEDKIKAITTYENEIENTRENIVREIIDDKDLKSLEQHLTLDVQSISKLQKLIDRIGKKDELLAKFIFASWLGLRIKKPKFNFPALGFTQFMPISVSNFIENLNLTRSELSVEKEEVNQEIVKNYVPLFDYSTSRVGRNSFPDCVETVIFNIIKIACYDFNRKKYDVELISESRTEIKNFFIEYNEHVDGNQEDKNKFATLVSFITNVGYKCDRYELLSTFKNIKNVLYYLLFSVQVRPNLDDEYYEKLQGLFEQFEIDESKNEINILQNNVNYTVSVKPGHSYILNSSKKLFKILKFYSYKKIILDYSDLSEEFGTRLHLACFLNLSEDVVNLVSSYDDEYFTSRKAPSVDDKNKNGLTPLHYACENGNSYIVDLLINYGANVNVSDNEGFTPLHFACKNGNLEIVKSLVDDGANVNAKSNNRLVPLQMIQDSSSQLYLFVKSLTNLDEIEEQEDFFDYPELDRQRYLNEDYDYYDLDRDIYDLY